MNRLRQFGILHLIFIVTSCQTPRGFPGVSDYIKDSKERGVFIQEYTVYPNPYKINDSMQITVKEAWVERQWIHTSKPKGAKIREKGYQLAINTTEEDLEGVTLDWVIGIYSDKYVHPSSANSLVGDLDTIPGDTICYLVQNEMSKWRLNKQPNVVGRFVLVKKQ